MEIKKKQHYVWKQYLKKWANNGKYIYFYRKNTNEIKSANLENVAQQRFFYEVDAFTEDEEAALKYMIGEWSTNYSRETNLELLNTFFTFSRTKRNWEKIDFPEKEHKLNVVKKNTLENLHTIFENFGERLLTVNTLSDLSFFDIDKERLKALIYMCVQYTRTNQMHTKALRGSSIMDVLPESALKIIAVTFAITLAANLTLTYNLKVTFIINSSNIEFITTDQPIINRVVSTENSNCENEIIEFYYPISPKHALLISTSAESQRLEHETRSDEEIMSFNETLLKSNPDFIFSKSERSLRLLM